MSKKNKNITLIALTMALLVTAGIVAANAQGGAAPQNPDQVRQSVEKSASSSESGDSRKTETSLKDLGGAKEIVTKFVLAVAHPEKTASATDRQSAQQYLTSSLQKRVVSEFGGDPAKPLSLTGKSRFQVGETSPGTSNGAQVTVTFASGNAGKPKSVIFQLQRQNENWLINTVSAESSSSRR